MRTKLLICALAVALLPLGCELDGSEEILESSPAAVVELDAMGLLANVEDDSLTLYPDVNHWTDVDHHCGVSRWQSCATQCPTTAQCGFCCNFHFQGDFDNPNYTTCRANCGLSQITQ